MKHRIPWDGRIHDNKIYHDSSKGQKGSIVLEAAIVLPILLFILVIFSAILSLCMTQTALNAAASQSVRQLASYVYPAQLALDSLHAANTTAVANLSVPLSDWNDIADQATEWLPESVGELVSSAIEDNGISFKNMAETELGKGIVEPFVQRFVNRRILQSERVKLELLLLPDLKRKEAPYIAIELSYEYPLKLPLIDQPIVIRERAYERVWVSDAAAAAYGSEGAGDHNGLFMQFVSIEPHPVRPGQKATVVLKTKPGAFVSLGVRYKSGASKAKHLGEAMSDENGYARWSWHVSGNTTPGIWELTVEGGDNAGSASKHFAVEKMQLKNS